MRNLQRRIENLERRTGGSGQSCLRMILMRAGQELALDEERCVEILRESGHCNSTVGLFDFSDIPDDLNAAELEQFLRRHGCHRRPNRGVALQVDG